MPIECHSKISVTASLIEGGGVAPTYHCGSNSQWHASHEGHAERADHGRDAGGRDEVALEAGDAVAPAGVGHEVVELACVSSNGIAVGLQQVDNRGGLVTYPITDIVQVTQESRAGDSGKRRENK